MTSASSGIHHNMSSRVVLVRHGETEWSRIGRHTGRTDIGLTDEGERQARALAGLLRGSKFARVLVSPLQRAQRTAELAGVEGGESIDDLAEWDYGVYEGRTSEDLEAEFGDDWIVWESDGKRYPLPGESIEQLGERADRVIDELWPTLAGEGDVLLVAHGHILRALASRWIGLPARFGSSLALSTATLSELGFNHGRRVIRAWNCPQLPH